MSIHSFFQLFSYINIDFSIHSSMLVSISVTKIVFKFLEYVRLLISRVKVVDCFSISSSHQFR